ncbi:MAG: hypothetical protein OHK0012_26200 [Synechococcales cyanobacterium]
MTFLTVVDTLPDGLLSLEATELHQVLPGPTLIHLPGRRTPPLFVSVLLHGNEVTGWLAIQRLLQEAQSQPLPRALSLLIGNVEAARYGMRRLPDQPDYNRIWLPGDSPEQVLAAQVVQDMRQRGVFASIDVHNNTGRNPHYACVTRTDPQTLQLAALFNQTALYFTQPEGVQSMAFSTFCPAVVLECGKPDHPHGVHHAYEYLRACLHLEHIPTRPVAPQDLHLLHTVAIVKVPPQISFGFGDPDVDVKDIAFLPDLDDLNFRDCPAHTPIAHIRPGAPTGSLLDVQDRHGSDVSGHFFYRDGEHLRTTIPIIPAMLTLNARIIRQDCLCYLLEEYPLSA